MTTTPDFRELCEQLIELVEGKRYDGTDVVAKARAALATPPPAPPTDDELNALWNCCGDYDEEGDHYGNIFQFARAVLKRWGAK